MRRRVIYLACMRHNETVKILQPLHDAYACHACFGVGVRSKFNLSMVQSTYIVVGLPSIKLRNDMYPHKQRYIYFLSQSRWRMSATSPATYT
jgi:hypothetical protein